MSNVGEDVTTPTWPFLQFADLSQECGGLRRKERVIMLLQKHSNPDQTSLSVDPHCQSLDQIQPKAIEWLWDQRIPRGAITVVEGLAGQKKGLLLTEIASQVSRGDLVGSFGEKAHSLKKRSVLLLSAEDCPQRIIAPNFEASGADLERIRIVSDVIFPAGLDRLQELVDTHKPAMIIVDPFSSFSSISLGQNQKLREQVLKPLDAIAAKNDIAIVLVRHLTKAIASVSQHQGIGGVSIAAHARSVIRISSCDLKGKDGSKVEVIKTSWTRAPEPVYFSCETRGQGVRVVWESIQPTNTHQGTKPPGQLEEAIDFLRYELRNGEKWVKELEKDAKDNGHAWRTVRRAKDELGVFTIRRHVDGKAVSRWKLPCAKSETKSNLLVLHLDYLQQVVHLPTGQQPVKFVGEGRIEYSKAEIDGTESVVLEFIDEEQKAVIQVGESETLLTMQMSMPDVYRQIARALAKNDLGWLASDSENPFAESVVARES